MTKTEQNNIFKTWLHQHKALLFKVVHAYAFTDADQDDLFQEMAIQIWRSVPAFRQDSAVTTWLYRISLNTAIKWTTKEQKHYVGRQPIDDPDYILLDLHNPVDERLIWIYEQIAALDEIDRSLMLLLLDGFSYKEISDIMGISESHVGVKIHRIKQHLINKLEKA